MVLFLFVFFGVVVVDTRLLFRHIVYRFVFGFGSYFIYKQWQHGFGFKGVFEIDF